MALNRSIVWVKILFHGLQSYGILTVDVPVELFVLQIAGSQRLTVLGLLVELVFKAHLESFLRERIPLDQVFR